MKVLLLGGTGYLGRRCIQALLAHQHTLTVYVRSPEKLQSLVTADVIAALDSVIVGDATNATQIAQALGDHAIEAIVNVAGNQVLPWKEKELPKIVRAVCDAAVAVGKERGRPLRVWVTSGINVLNYPGTPWLLNDFFPVVVGDAHSMTKDIVEAIPLEELQWSLICVANMVPSNPGFAPFTPGPRKPNKDGVFGLLSAPQTHNLLAGSTSPPGWKDTWLVRIPWVGVFLNLVVVILWQYETKYEDVADLLAEDLAAGGSSQWVGMRVGMKDRGKVKGA